MSGPPCLCPDTNTTWLGLHSIHIVQVSPFHINYNLLIVILQVPIPAILLEHFVYLRCTNWLIMVARMHCLA